MTPTWWSGRRAIRWAFLLFAGWILLRGGGSILADPSWEVHYAADPPIGVCAAAQCYAVYRLELGNTGRHDQPDVRVRLRRAPIENAVLPVDARTFGVTRRPLAPADDGDVRTYALGPVARRERVALTFTLRRPRAEPVLPWGQILVGVEATKGPVRTGSPPWIMVLRGWSAILVFL